MASPDAVHLQAGRTKGQRAPRSPSAAPSAAGVLDPGAFGVDSSLQCKAAPLMAADRHHSTWYVLPAGCTSELGPVQQGCVSG